MKKFKFSLLPVLKVKRTLKKQKEAEFAAASAALELLLDEERRLETELEHKLREYGTALQTGVTAREIVWHDHYVDYLKGKILALRPQIRAAEEKKEAVRGALVVLMQETDTLEKLEQEQYQEYLSELQKEEEKVLGDMMSFDSAEKLKEAEDETA